MFTKKRSMLEKKGTVKGADQADQREPLAIVGIGCRFAGENDSPGKLWQTLCRREVAFRDVPPERWSLPLFYDPDPDMPGKTFIRQGGFLDQPLDLFDASFFGILPREAECLDPQQRLMLECSWEALEDAGIPAERLAGTALGIYTGIFTLDSMFVQVGPLSRHLINPSTATSISATMVSNRLSYFYDARGPSFSVDTACSSSLVALHYACHDLWDGRTTMAMVGGANVMLRPEYPIAMAKGGFLSPDARCKPFDSRANGYARGEGAAVLCLKPLSAALAEECPIYATIVGTGINQDGRTLGITVPSFSAQKALIQQVYDMFRIDPCDTVYVEAHGTGTAAGDPIEARAIGEAIGQIDPGRSVPVLVGSLKANIGHTEAVAGVAGVIKAALCLYYRQVPPQANLDTLNPDIPFDALCLRIPRKLEALPRNGNPLQASVNSFGYGGANAHAVLRENPVNIPPVEAGEVPGDNFLFLTPFSARSPQSLQKFALACADYLEDLSVPVSALRRSLAFRRTHHPLRLAVVARDRADLIAKLRAYGTDAAAMPGVVQGKIQRNLMQKPAFVFTGMGPQWWGMGRELMACEPIFSAKAKEIDAVFRRIAGWSILEEMARDETETRITDNQYAQPANFVVQVALAALWRSWGIEPAAVIGHSVGEISAAHVAGALSLEDATLVSYHRSHAQQAAAGKGAMLAVGMAAEAVQPLLKRTNGKVEIAAINAPSSCTLSGDPDAIRAIADDIGTEAFFRILSVEVAYHSHHMTPLEEEIKQALALIQPRKPLVSLYSTVSGRLEEQPIHDAAYWWRNVRQPVLFADAITAMAKDGHEVYLEVGPHPVLKSSISECLDRIQVQGTALKTLERKKNERLSMLETVGCLYTLDADIDWERFIPSGKNFVRFPRYPWHRTHHWLESEESRYDRQGWIGHPLLGRRLSLPEPTWETEINSSLMPEIDDHVIDGTKLLPGACYVEAALEAGRRLNGDRWGAVENLSLLKALVIPPRLAIRLRIQTVPQHRTVSIHSRSIREGAEWIRHAEGTLSAATGCSEEMCLDWQEIASRLGFSEEADSFYRYLSERGLTYGPRFQGVQQLWYNADEVLARIELPSQVDHVDRARDGYGLHPVLLDASFQMMIRAQGIGAQAGGAFIPVYIRRASVSSPVGSVVWAHGRITLKSRHYIEADLVLADDAGKVVARVDGLRCQSVSSGNDRLQHNLSSWLYDYCWHKIDEELPIGTAYGAWLVLADRAGIAGELVQVFSARGHSCVLALADETVSGVIASGTDRYLLRPLSKEDMIGLLRAAKGHGIGGIVYCWGMDDVDDQEGSRRCIDLMHLMQAMRDLEILPRLVVITSGSQSVLKEEPATPAQAAVWGLARVIMNEIPEVRCRSLDLQPGYPSASLAIEVILADTEEDEIALRGDMIYLHRLRHTAISDREAATPVCQSAKDAVFVVEASDQEAHGGVLLRSALVPPPQAGEVTVHLDTVILVRADALALQGRLPAESVIAGHFSDGVGTQACGVIQSVGAGVNELSAGDVVLLWPEKGVLRSHIAVNVDVTALVPAMLGSISTRCFLGAQALSFVTGLLAIRDFLRLKGGETVFVSCDGCGWQYAAVQWSRRYGGTIIAACSEDGAQRGILKSLGVSVFVDAEAPDLAERVFSLSCGRGVDAVLCSTGDPLFEEHLRLLAPFGTAVRVVEREHTRSDVMLPRGLSPNTTITTLDIFHILSARTEVFRAALLDVWLGFKEGWLGTPPIEHLPVGRIEEGIDHLLKGELCGRIAFSLSEGDVTLHPDEVGKDLFWCGDTTLITGGLGGFGGEFARWVADHGAKCLVLIGRRGAATDAAASLIADIERKGVRVIAETCDIADQQAVIAMLGRVRATCPPIRGIVHAAAVFDDRFVLGMDAEGYRKVMMPKALGALILDQETRIDPVEMFITFSSVSALIGKPGQCNYVSANAVLDALAWRRRAEKRHGLSINWGVIGGTGVAARDDELREHLSRQGIRPIPYHQALDVIPSLLRASTPQIGVMDIAWEDNLGFLPSPRFGNLIGSPVDTLTPYVQELLKKESSERLPAIRGVLAKEVADVLRLPATTIEMNTPLSNMGVDSLTAVEIQTIIRTVFGINLSQLEILTGDGVAAIAEIIMGRLGVFSDDQALVLQDDKTGER